MRIFLDPGFKQECTVWFDDGNVQTLKGNIEEICVRIRNYVIDNFDDEDGKIVRTVQTKGVYLDIMGVGHAYYDILTRNYNIEVNKCKHEKRI